MGRLISNLGRMPNIDEILFIVLSIFGLFSVIGSKMAQIWVWLHCGHWWAVEVHEWNIVCWANIVITADTIEMIKSPLANLIDKFWVKYNWLALNFFLNKVKQYN